MKEQLETVVLHINFVTGDRDEARKTATGHSQAASNLTPPQQSPLPLHISSKPDENIVWNIACSDGDGWRIDYEQRVSYCSGDQNGALLYGCNVEAVESLVGVGIGGSQSSSWKCKARNIIKVQSYGKCIRRVDGAWNIFW